MVIIIFQMYTRSYMGVQVYFLQIVLVSKVYSHKLHIGCEHKFLRVAHLCPTGFGNVNYMVLLLLLGVM